MADTRQHEPAPPSQPPTLAEILKRIRDRANEKLLQQQIHNARVAGEIAALRKLHDDLEKDALSRAG